LRDKLEDVIGTAENLHPNLSIDYTCNEIRSNVPDISQAVTWEHNEQLELHLVQEIA
jgi:hypothetical protein